MNGIFDTVNQVLPGLMAGLLVIAVLYGWFLVVISDYEPEDEMEGEL